MEKHGAGTVWARFRNQMQCERTKMTDLGPGSRRSVVKLRNLHCRQALCHPLYAPEPSLQWVWCESSTAASGIKVGCCSRVVSAPRIESKSGQRPSTDARVVSREELHVKKKVAKNHVMSRACNARVFRACPFRDVNSRCRRIMNCLRFDLTID